MTEVPAKKNARKEAKAKVKSTATPVAWLTTGALTRPIHFILAHGAGAGMSSPFLNRIAALLDEGGVTVHRFEFSYMAARSAAGGRRPAPHAETLIADYEAAIADFRRMIGAQSRLFIGGKSMGGRIACLVSAAATDVAGVAVLGFPLVPPGRPEKSRAAVLEALTKPALLVQGSRDPFGGKEAFADVRLPACVSVHWIDDGDHDLKPRKASGLTHDAALHDAVEQMTGFFSKHRS